MAIKYNVIFEERKKKYKIAGVANNSTDKNTIAGSVSSKGIDYTAVIIDYSCNTPLNNDFFIVYTKAITETEGESDTFHEMVLTIPDSLPTSDDLFLYKNEKTAIDKMNALNDAMSDEDKKTKIAVMVPTKINTVY